MSIDGALAWTSESARAGFPPDLATLQAVASAARAGLLRPRKRLPPWLLYDRRGSDLFEQITELPEYYLTRAERAILEAHAGEMIEAAGQPLSIVELGAGSASKTQLLLAALLARQTHVEYLPVDVSAAALAMATAELARFRGLTVRPVVARYPEELGFLAGVAERRLVAFLGSNIGNYDPPAARALLAAVRRRLAPGDALLLGADLRKPRAPLLAAYDDAAGVTARFNRNVLARLNRELQADFQLERFRHLVRWNPIASRVELYLESDRPQRVALPALGTEIRFRAGERIHTESSYKLTRARLRRLVENAGFRWERSWYDDRRWFGVHLARVPPARRVGSGRLRWPRGRDGAAA